jgi:hypothetical protein
VFQWSFPLSWIVQHQIVQSRDATPVYQCRFHPGGLLQVETARFQSAILCRRGHPEENSPLTCLPRLFFWSAEWSFLRRECLAQQWDASCSELNAVLPQVCRAALVRLSPPAKLSLEVRHYHQAARLRLLSRRL